MTHEHTFVWCTPSWNNFFSWSIDAYLCQWLNKPNRFVVRHESTSFQFYVHIFFVCTNVTNLATSIFFWILEPARKYTNCIHNKSLWWIFEAAAISLFHSLNTRPGFYNVSPYLSKSILNSNNIFHLWLIHSTYIIILCFLFLFIFLFLPPFDLKSFSMNKRNINSIQHS